MKLPLLVLSLSLLLLSCKKQDCFSVYLDETRCSEKWFRDSSDSNSDKSVLIRSYFFEKNVRLISAGLVNEGTPDTCVTCACRTGKLYKVEIHEKDFDVLQGEGFYKMED